MALAQNVSESVTDEVLTTPPSLSSEHLRLPRSTKGTDEEEMMTKKWKRSNNSGVERLGLSNIFDQRRVRYF